MAGKKNRLTVISEDDTGMNQRFRDTTTNRTLTRTQVARLIDNGSISGYHHYRNQNQRLVIRSNPDNSEDNNLG